MGLRSNPTQRQRRIGHELRRLRESNGLKAEDAGEHVGLGGPHLRHIEGGRTAIPKDKLLKLLELFGCTRQTYVNGLLAMHAATGRGWWHQYRHIVSDRGRDLAELESMASSLRDFESLHVPGLLQAPEYAQALFESANPDRKLARSFHEFRMKRQEILTGPQPTSYHVVIHEAALRMRFVEPSIQRLQVTHLMEAARNPCITIQVIPFQSELLPAIGNPFMIHGSSDVELDSVMLEQDMGSIFIYELDQIARYDAIFQQLTKLALPPLVATSKRIYTSQRDTLGLLQHLLYVL